MMMPLASAVNSGGKQLDLFSGVNYYVTEGILKGIKIGVEVGYPLYQEVSGIQMKQDISAIIGVQYFLGKRNK